jgi:hypothetical protein
VLKQNQKSSFLHQTKPNPQSLLVIQEETQAQTHKNPSPNIIKKTTNIKTLQK